MLPGAGGVASRDDVNPRLTPKIGPPKYRAPEVESGAPYDCSSDMYGYGVMCFQLIEQLKKRTRKTNEREVEFIRELGRLATQTNPEKRPTARQCLTMCVHWLRGEEIITPDVYPGKETYREKYWVREPMDGGTWKHEGQTTQSPSDSPSDDEEPASPHSDGIDAGAPVDPTSAEDKTLLEHALCRVMFGLIEEASARATAVMSHVASSGANAKKGATDKSGEPSMPRLLDLALTLSETGVVEPACVFNALEQLVETCTIADCEDVFTWVEARRGRLSADALWRPQYAARWGAAAEQQVGQAAGGGSSSGSVGVPCSWKELFKQKLLADVVILV